MPLQQLACKVQNYAWGKKGEASAVAQLARANGDLPAAPIDAATPFAEYWFGTHPNGPSAVGGVPLSDHLGGQQLPYLFKVLSIAKCLSIQAHPDKARAQKLHAARPGVYKDPNHKPELAMAVTPFEAMCGFRAADEIVAFVDRVPEFAAVLGEAGRGAAAALRGGDAAALRPLFHAYATADAALVAAEVGKLVARVGAAPKPAMDAAARGPSGVGEAEALAARLAAQYPGDVGVFAPFLLNYLRLAPGDGVFLAANEPHAYVSGDCVEVMACSDNVVRMGCTPKLRDVPVLCEMLTYRAGLPRVMKGDPSGAPGGADPLTRVYAPGDPAVNEFQLERTTLAAGSAAAKEGYALRASPGPSVLLVFAGEGSATTGQGGGSSSSSSGGGGGGDATALGGAAGGRLFLLPGGEVATLRGEGLDVFRVCARRDDGHPKVAPFRQQSDGDGLGHADGNGDDGASAAAAAPLPIIVSENVGTGAGSSSGAPPRKKRRTDLAALYEPIAAGDDESDDDYDGGGGGGDDDFDDDDMDDDFDDDFDDR